MVSRDQIATLELTAAQLNQLSLSGHQLAFLSQDQKKTLNEALGVVEKAGLLEEGLCCLLTNLT